MIKSKSLLLMLFVFSTTVNIFAQQVVPSSDSLTLEERYEPEFLPTVYYTEGVRLAAAESYEEALGYFLKALELNPDHAPSLYETANIVMMLGDKNKALEYSSKAEALDPENTWYRGQKARLLVYAERYEEALPLFESMLEKNHLFEPDNYRILAILYHQQNRLDEAMATLDLAELRMGKNPWLTDLKRSILIDVGRVDEAMAVTQEYIDATPYDEENRLVLADLYGYLQKDSLRMSLIKDVLDINPNNVMALSSLADHYIEQGSTSLYLSTLQQIFLLDEVPLKDKITYFNKTTLNRNFYRQHFVEISNLALTLVTRYPGNSDVIELYSNHMIRSGDIEGALGILKPLLDQPEPPLGAFLQVIEIEAYLKRQDSVAMYSDRALKLYPKEQRVYMIKSGALQYMGRNKDARKVLEQALKIASTDSIRSEIVGSIGTICHQDGNLKKTYKYYEQALKYNPNNHHVLNNYAYFLSEENSHLDRALGMASRAIKLVENSATYMDTYAWVLYKQGNYTEAQAVMQRALPLDRTASPELLFHYGDILYALGKNFIASDYWKRARDAGYTPVSEIEERLSRLTQ